MEEDPTPEQETVDRNRREFLRKSVYAAYATPLITALLVEHAEAASSNGHCSPRWCANKGLPYPCCP
jgi:hypothetical protein